MTVAEVIAKVRILVGDHDADLFNDQEIQDELHRVITEVNQDLDSYIRSVDIPIMEDEISYTFPDDFLAMVSLNIDSFEHGRLVLNSTYSQILSGGYSIGDQTQNNAYNWGWMQSQQLTRGGRVSLRDSVSYNEIMFSPAFKADEPIIYNGETYSHDAE